MSDDVQGIVSGESLGIPYESSVDIGSMLLTLAKYAAATVVVLLVFWAFAYLLRRLLDKTGGQGGHGRIRVVESARLLGDKTLHIVRVDDREILIGASKDGISCLGELPARPAEESPWRELDSDGSGGRYRGGVPVAGANTVSSLNKVLQAATDRVAGLVGRTIKAIQGRSSAARSKGLAVEEAALLRQEALRISRGTSAFSELLDEEVSATSATAGDAASAGREAVSETVSDTGVVSGDSEASNRDDRGARLAHLRSLAAKSARRTDHD